MASDQFISVPEAGTALGVSEATIWRMIRRGALQSVSRGGRRLVSVETIDDTQRPRKVDTIPPLTPDHPIFRLVGAGRSGGVLPGARDKYATIDQ